MSARFRVERLAGQDRSGFDCGVTPLDRYLKRQASQDQKRRVSVCYLLIDSESDQIAGYYTLSASSVLLSDLPEATVKRLPRYPSVPVVRVGRLAVDSDYRGQKLGSVLIYDAVKRADRSGVGAYAVVVDAKDETAARFYEHHGFGRAAGNAKLLYLPLSDALRKLG